jgi:hypothetical protein
MILTEAKLIASALALAALIGFYAWFVHSQRQIGAQACKAEVAAVTLKATQEARDKEANWQTDIQAQQEVHDEELRRIASVRDAALRGLRNRAGQRLPATSSCSADGTGATGAQLSGPDAEAFAGLAADADRTAADLRTCQAWIKAVKPEIRTAP